MTTRFARRAPMTATAATRAAQTYDVVIVDDEPVIAEYLASIVGALDGVRIRTFDNPLDVLDLLPGRCPDLLITDNQMPQRTGVELVGDFRGRSDIPPIPIIVVTGDEQRETRRAALDAGTSDFLRKPVDPVEVRMRVRNMLELREGQRSAERRAEWLQSEVALATAEVAAREEETILSLARAVEYRDWETGGHIVRMAHYSRLIAQALDDCPVDPDRLFMAAPLHDVGKIGVPDHILMKPGQLTDEEFRVMQKHAEIGHEILRDCHGAVLALASEIAWTHHERWDGSGYPRALQRDEIPIAGRIVAVADVFDALVSNRPYKRGWTLDEAFVHVAENAGTHFDPACAEAFRRCESDVRRIAAENEG